VSKKLLVEPGYFRHAHQVDVEFCTFEPKVWEQRLNDLPQPAQIDFLRALAIGNNDLYVIDQFLGSKV
jgi:hypothetical protein